MINKSHKKYAEYKKKSEELRNALVKELDNAPISYGFDGASTAISKKYASKLKELQAEYSYLFTEGHK